MAYVKDRRLEKTLATVRTIQGIRSSKKADARRDELLDMEKERHELEVAQAERSAMEEEARILREENERLANQERISWLARHQGQSDSDIAGGALGSAKAASKQAWAGAFPGPVAEALGEQFAQPQEGLKDAAQQAVAKEKVATWENVGRRLSPKAQERFYAEKLMEEQEEQLGRAATKFAEHSSDMIRYYSEMPELGGAESIVEQIKYLSESVTEDPSKLPGAEKALSDLNNQIGKQVIDRNFREKALVEADKIGQSLGPQYGQLVEGVKYQLRTGVEVGKAFKPVIDAISTAFNVRPTLKDMVSRSGYMTEEQAMNDPRLGPMLRQTVDTKAEGLAIGEWQKMGYRAQEAELEKMTRDDWVQQRAEHLRPAVLQEFGLYGGGAGPFGSTREQETSIDPEVAARQKVPLPKARRIAEDLRARVEAGEMKPQEALAEFERLTGMDPREEFDG